MYLQSFKISFIMTLKFDDALCVCRSDEVKYKGASGPSLP